MKQHTETKRPGNFMGERGFMAVESVKATNAVGEDGKVFQAGEVVVFGRYAWDVPNITGTFPSDSGVSGFANSSGAVMFGSYRLVCVSDSPATYELYSPKGELLSNSIANGAVVDTPHGVLSMDTPSVAYGVGDEAIIPTVEAMTIQELGLILGSPLPVYAYNANLGVIYQATEKSNEGDVIAASIVVRNCRVLYRRLVLPDGITEEHKALVKAALGDQQVFVDAGLTESDNIPALP